MDFRPVEDHEPIRDSLNRVNNNMNELWEKLKVLEMRMDATLEALVEINKRIDTLYQNVFKCT